MKQQLVDPFIPASGQPPRHRAQAATKPQPAVASRPAIVRRGVSIDGVMRNGSSISGPRRQQAYRGPAPSLHLQYMPKIQDVSRSSRGMPPDNRQPRQQPVTPEQPTPINQAAPIQQPNVPRKERISTLWLVVGSATAGLAMFSVMAGQVAIAVYAVAALWRRWPSQQSFGLALVMFGGIILASLMSPFHNVVDNLAVYAFLLLCVGTISLAREVRRDMRQTAN